MSKSPPPVRLIKPFDPDAILCGISWFKEAVRDIRVFKVEDWSDFTNIVKQS